MQSGTAQRSIGAIALSALAAICVDTDALGPQACATSGRVCGGYRPHPAWCLRRPDHPDQHHVRSGLRSWRETLAPRTPSAA
jgi:hypothetical protein